MEAGVGAAAQKQVWVRFAMMPEDEAGRHPVDALWSDDRVRRAVRLASPGLADRLDGFLGCAHDVVANRQIDSDDLSRTKALRALRAYHTRMCTRPTPSGAMAGVFVGQLGELRQPAAIDLEPALIAQTEETKPAVVGSRDLVTVSPALERVATGVLLPPLGSLRDGRRLRHVPIDSPLQHALELSSVPITAGDLVDSLESEISSEEDRWRYVRTLEGLGVLVRVTAPPARTSVRVAAWKEEAERAEWKTDHPDGSRTITSVHAIATQAHGAILPTDLGRHAEQVVMLSDIVNPPREFPPHLAKVARSLRERFGSRSLVPLDDAFSVLAGVELAPCTSDRKDAWTDRDQLLLDVLGTGCQSEGAIELTPGLIRDLAASSSRPHVEIPQVPAVEVSLRPMWTVSGCRSEFVFAGTVGALGARFLHLIPDAMSEALTDQVTLTDSAFAPFEVVELVSRPRRQSGFVPVVRSALPQRSRILTLDPSEQHGRSCLTARDVLVEVSEVGLPRLISARTGNPLHVVAGSMAADTLMSRLDRFVLEICRAQFRRTREFDWGSLSYRKHLPRVSRGPVDLAPRRWLLSSDEIGDPRRLKAFCTRHDVPDRFSARPVGSDQSLLLNREDAEGLKHLARRSGVTRIELRSAPEGPGLIRDIDGGSHVAEVVVAVVTGASAPVTRPVRNTVTVSRHPTEVMSWDVRLPGAAVRPFLASPLHARWASLCQISPKVWYDVENGPTIRLCVPCGDSADEALLDELGIWLRRLRRDGSVGPVRQVEHHGHGRLLDLGTRNLHAFFAADSEAALRTLAEHRPASIGLYSSAAASTYRILSSGGSDQNAIRTILRERESRPTGALHRRIGADLYSRTRQFQLDAPSVLTRLRVRSPESLVSVAELHLARLALPADVKDALLAAVRRLLDREAHERRARLNGDER